MLSVTDLVLRLLLIGIAIAANSTAVALAFGSAAQRRLWPRSLVVFGGRARRNRGGLAGMVSGMILIGLGLSGVTGWA